MHSVGSSSRLPVGVRDFLPRAAARRRAIASALVELFEVWGYERIITPAFEYQQVLSRGLDRDTRTLQFIEPETGDVVAMRPDITPQVARLTATRLGSFVPPIRLCYEGQVLRLGPSASGQRELLQAGIELLGASPSTGDAEVIALAGAALGCVGLAGFTIDIGHTQLARTLLGQVTDDAVAARLREALARKDAGDIESLAAGTTLGPDEQAVLRALPELYGDPRSVFEAAARLPLGAQDRRALDALEDTLALAAEEGSTGRLVLDLGDVRGFDYYTGMHLSAFVPGVGDAVLSGGRYDGLLARFGRDLPAVGFAVDIEGVAAGHKAAGVQSPDVLPCVLVRPVDGQRTSAVRLAAAFRDRGVRAVCDLESRPEPDAVTDYARLIGAACVVQATKDGPRVVPIPGSAMPDAEATRKAAAGDIEPLIRALGLAGHVRRNSWQ